MSTAYHAQIYGHTERMNVGLEGMLRAHVNPVRNSHFPCCEFAITTSLNESTRNTPWHMKYSRHLRFLTDFAFRYFCQQIWCLWAEYIRANQGGSDVQDNSTKKAGEICQSGYKTIAVWSRSVCPLQSSLLHYKSGTCKVMSKLSHRFFGLCTILRRIGPMSYELRDICLLYTFHASCRQLSKGVEF